MEIVVTHLTRMSPGYVCVAGIDMEAGGNVRPVDGQLLRRIIESERGAFDLGNIVDLGGVTAAGSPPEVEDVKFDSTRARATGSTPYEGLLGLLRDRVAPSLRDVFGNALTRDGHTCSTPEGEGEASLGYLQPDEAELDLNAWGRLRLEWSDPDLGNVSVAVNDLRLYQANHKSVRPARCASMQQQLRGHAPILSVGLTRPYDPNNGSKRRHWLQVNNIWLPGDRIWRERDQR